jgi:TAT (twin-arginine translocation) pathway signal sequence./Xylose isomerase-like TIM barrel.
MYSRRSFLKAGGALASGMLLGQSAFSSTNARIKEFGLQLYSLRDDMPKDPKGILKQVASFGYKQIESFEGGQGMFWGMTNKEFKAYIDSLGMTIVSSHCNINKDFDKKAGEAAEIGMKYLICPSIGSQKSVDDWKKIADKFNNCGEICKRNGIRFAYHNHGYTFKELDGQMPQDLLLQNTDAALVDYQMDIYWVVTGGSDPIMWLNKYPNRFTLCHVKDRKKNAGNEGDASVDLGTGSIDYSKVLKVAKNKGMKYYIVEQEAYENSTPLKSVAVDAEYMKKLKI